MRTRRRLESSGSLGLGFVSFTVADNPAESRYELHDGDTLVGIATYRLSGETVTFTHTEVADAYEGQGAGSQLAREALDDSRAHKRRVVARCPFISAWIERHPDYADLLA
jgi:uncharacterized protein